MVFPGDVVILLGSLGDPVPIGTPIGLPACPIWVIGRT